jgi:hypothetical protein
MRTEGGRAVSEAHGGVRGSDQGKIEGKLQGNMKAAPAAKAGR